MDWKRFIRLGVLAALVGFWAGGDNALANPGASREYQLKAAFLYNFAQFVEWPDDTFDDSQAPIVIQVVGHSPFGGALDHAVRGKLVNGRRIEVRYYAEAAAVKPGHIVFLCASERNNIEQVLKKAGAAALTVGDYDRFTQDGGMFRFFGESNKVRFEVNLEAAKRSRLKISSKLLKLAKVYGR